FSGPKKRPKFRRIPDAPIYSEESDGSEESDSSLTIPKLISPKSNGTSKSSCSSSVFVPKKFKMLENQNLTSLERVDSSTIERSVSKTPQTSPR
ncbi:unnamed protein product, partial [Allacma fusca]